MNVLAEGDEMTLEADAVLSDPSTSFWLRTAVQEALARDPVDALNDALALAQVLDTNLRRRLALDSGE